MSLYKAQPKPYSAHAIAWAKALAVDARRMAERLKQLEGIAKHNGHGRDIINLMSMASDLEIQYRLTHEKKSLNPLHNVLG